MACKGGMLVSLRVIRKKEHLPSHWSEMEVYMNGEKVSSLYSSDSVEVQMKEETGELKVKYLLSKSVQKQVESGDVVEVSNAPPVKYLFYLLPAILLLIFITSAFDFLNLWITTVIAGAYIIFILFVKPLQIKDITSEHEKRKKIK